MLDKDLVNLYDVKSIRLREQLKRNIKKFPTDFMFELGTDEINYKLSKNAIPYKQHLGWSLPSVFTEQGISKLASILKSNKATDISIKIIRIFVNMRRFLQNNAAIFQRLSNLDCRTSLTVIISEEFVWSKKTRGYVIK